MSDSNCCTESGPECRYLVSLIAYNIRPKSSGFLFYDTKLSQDWSAVGSFTTLGANGVVGCGGLLPTRFWP